MESSSPLAAMHRPRIAQPWEKRDPFRLPRATNGGAAAFGLREQLHKPAQSYFSVQDVRGSSPAASLAADLSQNFRLDGNASPRFATPRRNLFSANSIADGHAPITTPEIVSSSPMTVEEMMDASPVAQKAKAPECSVVEITSPSPLCTPAVETVVAEDDDDEIMILDSPAPVSRRPSLEVSRGSIADRNTVTMRRPSISRMKGYTTTMVHPRISGGEPRQMPSFRPELIDSIVSRKSSASSLTESFEFPAAPEQQRPLSSSNNASNASNPVYPPLRCRTAQLPTMGALSGPRTGSPINGHARRPSNPFHRSRRNFRRTLSMFEHPEDIMRAKTEASTPVATPALEAVMDVEEAQEPMLPHFPAEESGDPIPRISKETLLEVLDGKYAAKYSQKMVIDCRFEYEYEGGHIDGAVNYNDKELLTTHLFGTTTTSPMAAGRTLIIFHCEYSAHRAPMMARHVRSQDRTANVERYPRLTYPDVYILQGGYSEFFTTHRARCYPQNYVEMSDQNHQRTCERELGRLKARKQPKLGRAKTFAFENRSSGSCFGSPGSPSAGMSRNSNDDSMMASPPPRRLVTY